MSFSISPFRIFPFLCFVCFVLLFIAFPTKLEAKQIQFSLVPDRDDIIQYEIELWKSDDLELEIPFRVLANPGPIQLFIPEGYEFFRIRAVAKRKVRGFWTDLYNVNSFGKKPKPVEKAIAKIPVKTDVLVPILTKDGSSELFLTSKQITIVPITITKHFKVGYRVNGGIWQTTTSPQMDFPKDGNYRLEYKVTNDLGVSDGMQIWEFKVDRTPPETKFWFQTPTFRKSETTYIAPNNHLIVEAKDSGSGISSIRYRYQCEGDQFTDYFVWKEETGKDLVFICPGNFQLELSSIDRLGNEETPKSIHFQKISKSP